MTTTTHFTNTHAYSRVIPLDKVLHSIGLNLTSGIVGSAEDILNSTKPKKNIIVKR